MTVESRTSNMIAVAPRPLPSPVVLEPPAAFRRAWPAGRAAFEIPWRPIYSVGKRALDITLAGAALALTLPLMLALALLIRLDSRGPVLIHQERLGFRKKPFGMLKFRTMHVNSEQLTHELMSLNEATGPLFKMRRDPRVTRAGRFLRRTSLDELPQLFNILLGDMTLVGPRPPLPRELDGYALEQSLRLAVVPGLTGLWQVSGRSDLPFGEMLRLDLEYIERRNLWLDLKILFKTLPCVLRGDGAY